MTDQAHLESNLVDTRYFVSFFNKVKSQWIFIYSRMQVNKIFMFFYLY